MNLILIDRDNTSGLVYCVSLILESDSATLHSNQSSRRESGAAGSGVLFKEELARELNIQVRQAIL